MTTNEDNKSINNPQKFSWKSVGTYNTYEEALVKKNALTEKHTKIKRCGDNGSLFSVKVGTKVKAKETGGE